MNGLGALLQHIAEAISPLISFLVWAFPLKIYSLDNGERGAILSFGKVRRRNAERGPGITVCFSFEELRSIQAMNGFVDTSEQSISTLDGKVMLVNGAVIYEITSYQKSMLETEGIEPVIENYAMDVFREHARTMTLDELLDSDKLANDVTVKINRRIRKHGAKVSSFMITDLRPHDMTMICDTIKDAVKEIVIDLKK